MKNKSNFFNKLVTLLVVLSLSGQSVAFAQTPQQQQDKLRIGYNDATGKVSFIGADSSKPIAIRSAQIQGLQADSRAVAMISPYAADFGLKNPSSELKMTSADQVEGRKVTHFQQVYNGVPIMGGEMIVNATDQAELLSLSAEISPDLALDTNPSISTKQAQLTALEAMSKSHQVSIDVLEATKPELWIYDSRLLEPDGRPATLVWRMEVKSKDGTLPINELVLVDAQRGAIVLNFNQIDTAWATGTADGKKTTPKQNIPHAQTSEVTVTPKAVNTSTHEIQNTAVAALPTTTYYVDIATGNDNNSCTTIAEPCQTINGAIGKAADGDTVEVAVGTYTGTNPEVVLINKSITLVGGWNSSFTTQNGISIIDGGGVRRAVTVTGNPVVIDNFTIQNGFVASIGAGIGNAGVLTLSNSKVIGNVSRLDGGGISSNGTMTINNTSISANSAGTSNLVGGGGGGGIENNGLMTLNNSLIAGNFILGGFSGSGINNFGTAILNNSTVSGNTGGNGEGIYNWIGAIVLNNSTITNNQSWGIRNQAGSVTSQNTIIAWNGMNVENYMTTGDCYNDSNYYNGTINSNGYNLIGNGTFCSFAGPGDIVGTSTSPIYPRLNPLQDNGGTTFTHALVAGSPAINAGNPASSGSGGNACLATDQRGITRPVDSRCDIGAYEGSAPWVPAPLVSTYTASGLSLLPGAFLCDQSQPNCTNGSNIDADKAQQFALGVYQFYASKHNRDSIDNNGMPIISSVHYQVNYPNAFWSGTQMVYGDGYSTADDVVGHELTHGVTQYESNLFYYYQSGAINESFSDVWGELYDQQNGLGNDAANVKWLMGEDLPIGAIRSMSNPPLYGDPDKMTSPNYYTGTGDSGGVHYNSGINNKAAYLMVDGGTFNGRTVTALGADKTLAIYYEVQTNLLTSGADYSDLYNALYQGCLNLVGGSAGIVLGDCQQVRNATDAVEMNLQPVANFNTDAPVCTVAGTIPNNVFSDDLESGTSNWTFDNGGYVRWQYDSSFGPYAHSGTHFLYADDYPDTITDATARLTSIVIPANGYLHFAQAYDFEKYSNDPNYYDGGVIEYSNNGGVTWKDAGALIDYNGYKGVIDNNWNNPLKGRSAFAGSSHGYISTRLNLASLAGQTVAFRWRMGLDDFGSMGGWFVDDVQVYNCTSSRTISGNVGTAGVTLSYIDGTVKTATSQANGSYSFVVPYHWSGTVTPTHPCFTFSPANTYYLNVTTNLTAQNYTPTFVPSSGCANINVDIGGVNRGTYGISAQGSLRMNYAGVDSGPVKVESTNSLPIISAIRDAWIVNGVTTSFSQLMGLPLEQLSDQYVFPGYNNVTLNDQLRIANVDTVASFVTVTIGGTVRGNYYLEAGQAVRINYPGLDSGPVVVQSSSGVKIISSIREAWAVNGTTTSFAQLMGLPAGQLSNKYVFPAYNNVTLNEQLRIGNVDSTQSTVVTVTIGGVLQGTYPLGPGEAVRVNYPGLDSGPVVVEGTAGVNIISAIRDAWAVNGVTTSFSQLMGMPAEQLSDQYLFPGYNNVTLNDQLRIANVDTVASTVTVTIGGVNRGTYPLAAGEAVRINYPGLDSGPVVVQGTSGVKIISSIREAWSVGGVTKSFVQLMGLPSQQISTTYLFPAYNNVTLNEQLRIAVP